MSRGQAFRLEPASGLDGFCAVPDLEHGFYFDHPLGHLPGLLLLDMAMAAVERAADLPRPWFSRFDMSFRALAALHVPIDLAVNQADDVVRCTLSQRGKTCAELSAQVTAEPGGCPVSGARYSFTPVPLAAVRKLRPENVFLGEQQDDGCWPLAVARWTASVLTTSDGAVYRPVYLAECFLQLCRASREAAGTPPGVIPASREILVHLGGELTRPVADDAPLRIAFANGAGGDATHPRAVRRAASILSGDDSVCHFFCDAIPF